MPKWSRMEYRAILRYNYERRLSVEECMDEMEPIFGDDCPSRATVFRWYKQFQRGVFEIEDEPRPGRPTEAVHKDNVIALQELITNDRRITYRQIEVLLKMGTAAVNSILHDHIFYRKVCGEWVPQVLTDEQKAERVKWCKNMLQKFENGTSNDVYSIVTGDELNLYAYDVPSRSSQKLWSFEEDIPNTVKLQARTLKNKTLVVFFGKRGLIERVVMEEKVENGDKIDWYVKKCLPTIAKSLKNLRPKSSLDQWHFHHNNAPTFQTEQVRGWLQNSGMTLLEHPPNSPDLAPCDFGLFPYLNRQLKGHQFEDDEELINAWDQACAEIPADKWNEIFDSWFIRMVKCIESNGEYIEKI